jgi:hypothetical protein
LRFSFFFFFSFPFAFWSGGSRAFDVLCWPLMLLPLGRALGILVMSPYRVLSPRPHSTVIFFFPFFFPLRERYTFWLCAGLIGRFSFTTMTMVRWLLSLYTNFFFYLTLPSLFAGLIPYFLFFLFLFPLDIHSFLFFFPYLPILPRS